MSRGAAAAGEATWKNGPEARSIGEQERDAAQRPHASPAMLKRRSGREPIERVEARCLGRRICEPG